MAAMNVRLCLLATFLVLFIGWGLVADAKPIEKPEEADEPETPTEVSKEEDADEDADGSGDADAAARSKVKKHENDCKREFHVKGACHPFHEHPEFDNEGNYDDDKDDGDRDSECGRCCWRDRRSVVITEEKKLKKPKNINVTVLIKKKKKATAKAPKKPKAEIETDANNSARDCCDCCCGDCCHHDCHHCCHHDCHHCCHHDCHHCCHHDCCHHDCCHHDCHHCCHDCHHDCHHCHHDCCHHCCGCCGKKRGPCAHGALAPIGAGAILSPIGRIGCGHHVTPVVNTLPIGPCGTVHRVAPVAPVGGDCGTSTTAIHNIPIKVNVAVGQPHTSHVTHNGGGCGTGVGHHGGGVVNHGGVHVGGVGVGHPGLGIPLCGCGLSPYGKSDVASGVGSGEGSGEDPETIDSH